MEREGGWIQTEQNQSEDEFRASSSSPRSALFSRFLSEPVCVKLMAATLVMDQTRCRSVLKELREKKKDSSVVM